MFDQKIIATIAVLILLYTTFTLSYPFIWAKYISKTEAPIIDGQIVFGLKKSGSKALEVAIIGDSTALGQGAEIIENSFSYQYLQANLAKNQSIKYDNFAISGARINDVLNNQVAKISLSADIIFVSIGANDVTAFMSKSDFTDKIKDLIKKLEKFDKSKIIWMNIPDLVTVPVLLPPLNYILSNRCKEFNLVIEGNLNQDNFVYVDVFNGTRDEFWNNPDKNYARDKYHPSTAGYKLWVDVINKTVKL